MKSLFIILFLFISYSANALANTHHSKEIITTITYKHITKTSNEAGQNILRLLPNSKETTIASFMSDNCSQNKASNCQYFSLSCRVNKIEKNRLSLAILLKEKNRISQKNIKKNVTIPFGQKTNIILGNHEEKFEINIALNK
jgi:hypothetical protein